MRHPSQNWVGRTASGSVLTTTEITIEGDCGMIYCGRIGKSWFVRAMHYQLLNASIATYSRSVGAILTVRELTAVTSRLGAVFQGVYSPPSLYSKDGVVGFFPLPVKSEVATALTRGCGAYVLGEMSPRPFGSSPTSSVKRSLVATFFEDLELEWCGEKGYWRPPVFKGHMSAEGWHSPWQSSLLAGRPSARLDFGTALVAVCDYVSGLRQLGVQPMRFYTEDEVIGGKADMWVNPINSKTSCGPPFYQKKYLHYAHNADGNFMSAQMEERALEFEDVLQAG